MAIGASMLVERTPRGDEMFCTMHPSRPPRRMGFAGVRRPHHHQAAPRVRLPQLRLLKLNELIAATTLFVLDRRSPGEGKAAIMYVRDKRHQDKKPGA